MYEEALELLYSHGPQYTTPNERNNSIHREWTNTLREQFDNEITDPRVEDALHASASELTTLVNVIQKSFEAEMGSMLMLLEEHATWDIQNYNDKTFVATYRKVT